MRVAIVLCMFIWAILEILHSWRLRIHTITFRYMCYRRQDDGFKVFYYYEEGRDIWAEVGTQQWEEREEEGSSEEGKEDPLLHAVSSFYEKW